MTYQKVTGSLMAHGVSDGQDAYNNMLVTEIRNENKLGRIADLTDIDLKKFRGGSEDAGQRQF